MKTEKISFKTLLTQYGEDKTTLLGTPFTIESIDHQLVVARLPNTKKLESFEPITGLRMGVNYDGEHTTVAAIIEATRRKTTVQHQASETNSVLARLIVKQAE